MPRRNVRAIKWIYRCPVCPRQAEKLAYVTQHLAMKMDEKHEAWRVNHGLSKGYETISDVMKMKNKIIEIRKKILS